MSKITGYSWGKNKPNPNKIEDIVNPVSDHKFNVVSLRNLINPNFLKDRKYQLNCSLCTAAIILQMRGYDVEAMPTDLTWRGTSDILEFDVHNYENYVMPANKVRYCGTGSSIENYKIMMNNPTVFKASVNFVTEMIMLTMLKWGKGAVAELCVSWKKGGAHSMAVVNIDGKVAVVDGQTGSIYSSRESIQHLIGRTKPGSAFLQRWDNASFVSKYDLSKIVQKR